MAGSISSIVREYYDSFFESMEFYHEMVRDEVDGYRKSVAELRGKLASTASAPDKAALAGEIADTQESIDLRSKYLESGRIASDAIEYATNTIENMEPELAAKFNAEPVSGKYECLMEWYRTEHAENVQTRIADAEQSFNQAAARLEEHSHFSPTILDSLTSFGKAGQEWNRRHKALERETAVKEEKLRRMVRHADLPFVMELEKEAVAENKIRKLFPDIANLYLDEERKRHDELLRGDPFELGEELLEDHMVLYADMLADELARVENDLDHAKSLLSEHQDNKPGMLRNFVTLGRAQVDWREKEAELWGDVVYCAGELSKVQTCRKDVEEGGGFEWAESQIRKKYPELMAACEVRERELQERAGKPVHDTAQEAGRDGREGDAGLAAAKGMTR